MYTRIFGSCSYMQDRMLSSSPQLRGCLVMSLAGLWCSTLGPMRIRHHTATQVIRDPRPPVGKVGYKISMKYDYQRTSEAGSFDGQGSGLLVQSFGPHEPRMAQYPAFPTILCNIPVSSNGSWLFMVYVMAYKPGWVRQPTKAQPKRASVAEAKQLACRRLTRFRDYVRWPIIAIQASIMRRFTALSNHSLCFRSDQRFARSCGLRLFANLSWRMLVLLLKSP